jgi:hypothetical protein
VKIDVAPGLGGAFVAAQERRLLVEVLLGELDVDGALARTFVSSVHGIPPDRGVTD